MLTITAPSIALCGNGDASCYMQLRTQPHQAPRHTAMTCMFDFRFHCLRQSSDRNDTCQRKQSCSLKIRSARNIMLSVTAASRIERGYLIAEKKLDVTYGAITYRYPLRPNAQMQKIMPTRSAHQTLNVFQTFGQKSSSVSG